MEKGGEQKIKATAEALSKMSLEDFRWHTKEVNEVEKSFGTDLVRGLTTKKAEEIQA